MVLAEICGPRYCTVRLFIMIGCLGLSLTVGTLLIAVTMSMPSITLPKTGCWDGVDLSNQSKKLLCTTLMKNWLPPVFGWPVFAMLSVPMRCARIERIPVCRIPVSRYVIYRTGIFHMSLTQWQ